MEVSDKLTENLNNEKSWFSRCKRILWIGLDGIRRPARPSLHLRSQLASPAGRSSRSIYRLEIMVWLRPAGWGVVGVDQIGDNLLHKNARHHGFPVYLDAYTRCRVELTGVIVYRCPKK